MYKKMDLRQVLRSNWTLWQIKARLEFLFFINVYF